MRMWEGYDLDECKVWAKEVPEVITARWLFSAFVWSLAPFGGGYWSNVHTDLYNDHTLSPYNRDLINAIVTGKP